jgi:hypothetical protein
MPSLLIVLGVIGIIWGTASYMGWLPTVRRAGLTGGVHPDMAIIGAGLVLAGIAAYLSIRLLNLAAIALILIGVALWVRPPSWLEPGWYKRRFPKR